MEFKKSQFNDWYNEVIELSKLADKRYPVKGMDIWMPYGLAIMQNIDSYYRLVFNDYGHQELNFPLLIPKDQFDKEEEHIK
ncbi:MAG: proline--tRNA ligase, partial [Thermoplasmata archaeon]